LVEYPDVTAAMRGPAPAARDRLNRTLELLAARTDAAVIYVIDRSGHTVAASNWQLPTSFVGQYYGFRPYFRDAMRTGASELFALGTVSGRPGLYLARRVVADGVSLGTVVVKVEFDRVETGWARAAGPSFVTDPHGVILITSEPGWRFRTTHPLDPATAARARRTLQFGTASLRPAPLDLSQTTVTATVGGRPLPYRSGTTAVPLNGAQLTYLEPLTAPLVAANTRVRLWNLVALIVIGVTFGTILRARERTHMQREAQARLEHEVERRTAELRETNERLRVESCERADADRRFRAAREELTQANRLGSIGQITAGVAHEINQPVAAIRTFAENAGAFLDRDLPDQVRGNLAHIVDLTTRIGTITAELRNFARRRTPSTGTVTVASVIDGALLLAGDRVRDMVEVEMTKAAAAASVVADRVRLEQIVLNLLQNAAEALFDTPVPKIRIHADLRRGVSLTVSDNGPGIALAIADQIFTPFVTGKLQGLGLGLGIARDIAREFGGELETTLSPLGGAAFLLRLKRA